MQPWIVHKFGGTSLADADRYRHVARLLGARPEPRRAVVVSAMGGVTNTLIRAVELAGARDPAYRDEIDALRRRHRSVVSDLVPLEAGRDLLERIDADLDDVADVLHATWLLRSYSRGVVDLVAGYGEVWSAQVLAAHLAARDEPARWMDARQVLVVRWDDGAPQVDWPASRERLDQWSERFAPLPDTLVVTGYVAGTPEGLPTTLGRNGSDFSASIFSALLDAARSTSGPTWTA